MISRGWRTLVVGTIALAAACSTPVEGPTPVPPRATPAPAAGTEAPSSPASLAATPAATPAATETPRPTPVDLPLDVMEIPEEATTPLLEAVTDGRAVIWSSGAAGDTATGADLYRLVAGGPAPELVFHNPDRDSSLIPIVAGDGHYVFSEVNAGLYGQLGWGLWYLSGPGAEPVELDRFDARSDARSPYPAVAIDGDRIVWAAWHVVDAVLRSELVMVRLPDLERTVLASAPVAEREFAFPDLDGERLVYGSSAPSGEGGQAEPERHVHLVSLDQPGGPRQLDDSGLAAMPLIRGDTVVWKEPDPEFDVRNWGTLVRHSLSTGATQPLSFGRQRQLNYPSMGNRFVGGWGLDSTRFYLYDLVEDRPVRMAEFDPTGPDSIVRPHLAGDLVVFIRAHVDPATAEQRPLRLQWARLPPPP